MQYAYAQMKRRFKVMKKFFKIFLITFVICCVFFASFILRNYVILQKIYNLQEDTLAKLENSNNFLYEMESTDSVGDVKRQIYCKDGIYKSVTYFKGELDSINYLNTNEQNEQNNIDKDYFINDIKSMSFMFVDDDIKEYITKMSICRFIKSKDNQYIISIPKTETDMEYYYINKENGMIEKWETFGVFTFKITENVVNDADIQK